MGNGIILATFIDTTTINFETNIRSENEQIQRRRLD